MYTADPWLTCDLMHGFLSRTGHCQPFVFRGNRVELIKFQVTVIGDKCYNSSLPSMFLNGKPRHESDII